MTPLSPEALQQLVAAQYPPSATCWGQATDEVRDMCRGARELAGVPESLAVDFRSMATPAEWNTLGAAGILKFYQMLTPEKQGDFCARFGPFLAPIEATP